MILANYSIAPENYNKPTPRKLKKWIDIILFVTMIGDFLSPWLDKMPEIEGKVWILWIFSGFMLLLKFISKMVTDADVYENP